MDRIVGRLDIVLGMCVLVIKEITIYRYYYGENLKDYGIGALQV